MRMRSLFIVCRNVIVKCKCKNIVIIIHKGADSE